MVGPFDLQQVGLHQDGREEIVEFVGNAADQFPHGTQAAALGDFGVLLFALRHVLRQEAAPRPIGVPPQPHHGDRGVPLVIRGEQLLFAVGLVGEAFLNQLSDRFVQLRIQAQHAHRLADRAFLDEAQPPSRLRIE